MDIPTPLRTAVENGEAVLMLGAGASLAATDAKGNRPPTASELGKLLCKRFLRPDYERFPLNQIADFSISESSLFEVQDFIRETFQPFQPSPSHQMLPTFRWRAIVTTNYDCLIEDAFRGHTHPIQKIVPLYTNTDRWDDVMRDSDCVPLLKLHGCVTKTHDNHCPLILSTEQYINYRMGRSRLFRLFQELASERSFLFIGYSNTDHDIRTLINELDTENVGRYRSFLVSPSVDDIVVRYWSPRQITAIKGNFEEAVSTLDGTINSTFRGIRKPSPVGTHAITTRFVAGAPAPSAATAKALELDVEYVKDAVAGSPCDPHKFYSGLSHTWQPIIQSLDVRRRLHDTILSEYFLDDTPSGFRFIVIEAHAGAGKSVFLRRLAWEATHEFDRLCLFAASDASLSSSVLQELAQATKEHIYLFIDDVVLHRGQIENLIHNLGSAATWLTIIGGARKNEWNVTPPAYQSLVTDEHTLPYLSDAELDLLISKLEEHDALKELVRLPETERRQALKQKAGRVLLVALHEATSGRPFEEILHDEFAKLSPDKLKALYLSICFLNQFAVPVRAGIISRRFGITFEQFSEQLFKPLEEVVEAIPRRGINDYCYVSRHPHVAEIVVRNELSSVDDLYNEYVAALQELNIGYSSDKEAFNRLAQGRRLASHFPDPNMVYRIFDVAKDVVGAEQPYLLQQMALYEMARPDGNLGKASSLLEKAAELAPRSRIILHSRAELLLKIADKARNDLQRTSAIAEAEKICRNLKRDATDSYAHSTLIKAGLHRLRRAIENDELLKSEDIEGMIKSIEKDLKEGTQRFPGDSHLPALEAELAKMLCESDRVTQSLKRSFDNNHRNEWVALQLASTYEQKGDVPGAQKVFNDAIEANRSSTRLHFAYGKLMLAHEIGGSADRLFHFRQSFRTGDTNYEAQILYGRELFIAGRFDDARDVFEPLKKARLPASVKRRQLYPLVGMFIGIVEQVEAWYCLIRRDGDGVIVRCDHEDSDEEAWRGISRHAKVQFQIAFTMHGPEASDLSLI